MRISFALGDSYAGSDIVVYPTGDAASPDDHPQLVVTYQDKSSASYRI